MNPLADFNIVVGNLQSSGLSVAHDEGSVLSLSLIGKPVAGTERGYPKEMEWRRKNRLEVLLLTSSETKGGG